ncbi:acyltransferase [Pseudophaeobacter sp.]|uniref:acyltransferase n=1 Tax=Pseudophaeobacter sp. TaxID=1971739 RepID=UPI0040582390
MIARNCTIIGLKNITISHNVRIDGGTTIAAAHGSCSIGAFIHIASGCHLACVNDVTLGDFVGLSQGVRLYSASDHSGRSLTTPTIPAEFQTVTTASVKIGKHVIVGSGCVILPGADIGECSSVGVPVSCHPAS